MINIGFGPGGVIFIDNIDRRYAEGIGAPIAVIVTGATVALLQPLRKNTDENAGTASISCVAFLRDMDRSFMAEPPSGQVVDMFLFTEFA